MIKSSVTLLPSRRAFHYYVFPLNIILKSQDFETFIGRAKIIKFCLPEREKGIVIIIVISLFTVDNCNNLSLIQKNKIMST